MRPLNFRAWDKVNKRMVDVINIEGIHRFVILEVRIPGTKEYYEIDNEDDFVLMQWTSLCDSKGKEIYDGDLLRYVDDRHSIVEVAWGKGRWVAIAYYIKINLHEAEFEICGNIFQNPKLKLAARGEGLAI